MERIIPLMPSLETPMRSIFRLQLMEESKGRKMAKTVP